MTSISPNTGSCCPPGSYDATGGGPVLDPALDAGPTGSAPLGVAPAGPSDLPPPPATTGEIPGASAPTGYDSTPVDVAGGGPAYLPAPAPVDVAGVSGPGVVDPGSSTASVTSGGPEAAVSEGIVAGGGPGGVVRGGTMPQQLPLPGWNSNYGDAFAKAFDQAGVDPATASTALHSLAAMGASAEELDQTLAYLQTEDGASLAPYMAEELAGQAPSYARIGMDAGSTTQGPMPDAGSTGQIDPTTGQPIEGAPGEPTPVAQTEDGGIQMSDGSTHYEDGSIIQPDGTMVAPDGSTLSPDGTLTRADGTTAKIDMATGQEIDPTTGKPVDPNAAAAEGAEAEPPKEGGMSTLAKFGIAGAAVLAVGGVALWMKRSRAEAQPLPGLGGTDGPAAPRPNGGSGPDGPAPRTNGAPRSTSPAADELRARFRQNAGVETARPAVPRTTTPTAADTYGRHSGSFESTFNKHRDAILKNIDRPDARPTGAHRTGEPARNIIYRDAVARSNAASRHGALPNHGMAPGRLSVADLIAREGVENVGKQVGREAAEQATKNIGKNLAQDAVKLLPRI